MMMLTGVEYQQLCKRERKRERERERDEESESEREKEREERERERERERCCCSDVVAASIKRCVVAASIERRWRSKYQAMWLQQVSTTMASATRSMRGLGGLNCSVNGFAALTAQLQL